ncbi:MAG: hypothetical protein J6L98_01070 [Bacteroidales bacterium]|nr:hypothetical protein [Bacteroidales bacterium]
MRTHLFPPGQVPTSFAFRRGKGRAEGGVEGKAEEKRGIAEALKGLGARQDIIAKATGPDAAPDRQ